MSFQQNRIDIEHVAAHAAAALSTATAERDAHIAEVAAEVLHMQPAHAGPAARDKIQGALHRAFRLQHAVDEAQAKVDFLAAVLVSFDGEGCV